MLPNRPVAGSMKPLFSPKRDILPRAPSMVRNSTSSSGFLTGRERSSTSFTRLKMAVLAPMPSASDSTAMALKPGALDELTEGELEVGHGSLDGIPSAEGWPIGYPNASILILSRGTPSDVR